MRDTDSDTEEDDDESQYSFMSREEIEVLPASNLKRWGNVTLNLDVKTLPKSHTADTKQIPEYVNNINPIKEWRQNHLKQLEKRLDLVLIEEDEEEEGESSDPLHFVRSLDKQRPSNPSLDKISSSDSLVATSSGLGDIMEEDEDDVENEEGAEVRASVNSDITFGRTSNADSKTKQEYGLTTSMQQKPSFIRGLLGRPEAIKSKIPIFHQKTQENQEDLVKSTSTNANSSFRFLGGRSLSDGKPKSALLSKLYNIGKPKAVHSKDKGTLGVSSKDDVLDWKKAKLFDDADDDEFEGDFIAIREMKRFLKKYKVCLIGDSLHL